MGVGKGLGETKEKSTGIPYSKDTWLRGSRDPTLSQIPGCCIHMKEGVPLLTSYKGMAWSGRGHPFQHPMIAKTGEKEQGRTGEGRKNSTVIDTHVL